MFQRRRATTREGSDRRHSRNETFIGERADVEMERESIEASRGGDRICVCDYLFNYPLHRHLHFALSSLLVVVITLARHSHSFALSLARTPCHLSGTSSHSHSAWQPCCFKSIPLWSPRRSLLNQHQLVKAEP